MHAVIQGNREVIQQGLDLIQNMTREQYNYRAQPYIQSSVGEHLRHILDIFYALVHEEAQGFINYDIKRRGAEVESNVHQGIAELGEIADWLAGIDETKLGRSVQVNVEVTLKETRSISAKSTLARELAFVASHAAHHYALMSVAAKLGGISVDRKIGLAPNTASFVREEEACAQ